MMEMVMGKMQERFARAGARSKPEFFKEGAKLDWPKPKASRQSKKDVRATRPLSVCEGRSLLRAFLKICCELLGGHSTDRSHQQTVFEPCSKTPGVRSCTTHNSQGCSFSSIFFNEHPRGDLVAFFQ